MRKTGAYLGLGDRSGGGYEIKGAGKGRERFMSEKELGVISPMENGKGLFVGS